MDKFNFSEAIHSKAATYVAFTICLLITVAYFNHLLHEAGVIKAYKESTNRDKNQ